MSGKPCRNWASGHCSRGGGCPFAHRGPAGGKGGRGSGGGGGGGKADKNICKFWKEGHCSYGASCRFSHAGPSGGRKKGKKGTDVDMTHGGGAAAHHKKGTAAAAAATAGSSRRKFARTNSVTIPHTEDAAVPGLVAELCLTQEAQEQIVKLFNIMDRNSDGVLSSDDFLYFRGEEKWRELRVQLDSSGDGVVTVEEFREGFKRHALKQPGDVLGLPAPDTALGVWLAELERRVNARVCEICAEVYSWYIAQ